MTVSQYSAGRAGHSLTEMLVATAMSAAIVTGTMMSYVGQRTALHNHELLNERNQNVRSALRSLTHDLRMTGYGLKVEAAALPAWIDWAKDTDGSLVTLTGNPMVLEGTAEFPDALLVCGAFGEPLAELDAGVAPGATSIEIGFGQATHFNTTDRSVIFIGRTETARITEIQGDRLLISTDPTEIKELGHAYPAGSPIELVQAFRYECDRTTLQYPYEPRLLRNDCASSNLSFSWQRMVGTHVHDLQFEMDEDLLTVTLTGQSMIRAPNATTEATENRERPLVVAASVLVRNRLE